MYGGLIRELVIEQDDMTLMEIEAQLVERACRWGSVGCIPLLRKI